MRCPLCGIGNATFQPRISRSLQVDCDACGSFSITDEAQSSIGSDRELAFKLGSWVSEQARLGTVPRLDQEMVARVRLEPHPFVSRRIESYLGAVIRLQRGKLIGRFDCGSPPLRVAGWCYDENDCVALAKHLVSMGAVEVPENSAPGEFRLIAKGHVIHEELSEKRAQDSQAFVAMWFGEEVRDLYERGLAPAIREAGYEPVRVDKREHVDRIDDCIIAEIGRSAFLVADFTGHRGGVYYEAGFAHGLGRRAIFTCRSDNLKNLHFDVRQYNTLEWQDPAELIAPLKNRILALFGAGPLNLDAKPA